MQIEEAIEHYPELKMSRESPYLGPLGEGRQEQKLEPGRDKRFELEQLPPREDMPAHKAFFQNLN